MLIMCPRKWCTKYHYSPCKYFKFGHVMSFLLWDIAPFPNLSHVKDIWQIWGNLYKQPICDPKIPPSLTNLINNLNYFNLYNFSNSWPCYLYLHLPLKKKENGLWYFLLFISMKKLNFACIHYLKSIKNEHPNPKPPLQWLFKFDERCLHSTQDYKRINFNSWDI